MSAHCLRHNEVHVKIIYQVCGMINSHRKLLVGCCCINDLTIGWQNLNLLSHPTATLGPQARQARASCENLNYMTLSATSKAKCWNFELLAVVLFWYPNVRSLSRADTLGTVMNSQNHSPTIRETFNFDCCFTTWFSGSRYKVSHKSSAQCQLSSEATQSDSSSLSYFWCWNRFWNTTEK